MAGEDRAAPTDAEMTAFFERATYSSQRHGQSGDLLSDYGVDGDDAFEFIEAFSNAYGVNMQGYCWFFHHFDEGGLLSFTRFGNPHRYVDRIPITAALLADAAHLGRWPVDYPADEMARAVSRACRERRILQFLVLLSLGAVVALSALLIVLLPKESCPEVPQC
ncbi:MAG: DUF1493 family protein [Pseudomonadota bacterium]